MPWRSTTNTFSELAAIPYSKRPRNLRAQSRHLLDVEIRKPRVLMEMSKPHVLAAKTAEMQRPTDVAFGLGVDEYVLRQIDDPAAP